jgi:bifunctional DNA-binding transcriptional regulator/antitoxin component of YhaV-PrlF toxin-antitoxin module
MRIHFFVNFKFDLQGMDKEVQKEKLMVAKKSIRKEFIGTLEDPQLSIDAAFITFPYSVKELFGTHGQVKVKVTFDGYPYRGILSTMGSGAHAILVRKDVRAAIGKKIGDRVAVVVEQDIEERVVDMPTALTDLLKRNKKALAFFESLSFTNRKEYALWISSAKRPETKTNRLEQILTKLLDKKKNPSEK